MIGVIGAIDVEVTTLISQMDDRKDETYYGYTFYSGKLCGKEIVLVKCGVGKVNAAVCTQTMIIKYSPDLIINSGIAGSLSKEIDILNVIIASDVVQHDIDTTDFGDPMGYLNIVNGVSLPIDKKASAIILDAAREIDIVAISGRIASGDQFISSVDKKNKIVKNFNAIACEMESGAIAQTCFISGVRCAIIRSISDATDDNHAMEFTEYARIAAEIGVKLLMTALPNLN